MCYVLFVGNRGLCGVYNHAVLRYAQELVQAEARPCTVVVCGSWGKDIIRQSGLPVQHTFDAISDGARHGGSPCRWRTISSVYT